MAIVKPGTLARAESWPPWEDDRRKSPHPILIAAAYPNGNVLVLPISHSRDLCAIGIELVDRLPSGPVSSTSPHALPTAFGSGGVLTMRDGASTLFLKEQAGRSVVNSGALGSPEPGAIRFGQWGRLILTSKPLLLPHEEWEPLRIRLRQALGMPAK